MICAASPVFAVRAAGLTVMASMLAVSEVLTKRGSERSLTRVQPDCGNPDNDGLHNERRDCVRHC